MQENSQGTSLLDDDHQHSHHQPAPKPRKQPPRILNYAVYAMLILLICTLAYDIKYFLTDSPVHPRPPAKWPVNVQLEKNQQTVLALKEKDKQFKGSKSLSDAQLKKLKLIQLEREIMKIDAALRSKQPQNDVLIATHLQKLQNNQIKYWDFSTPSTKQSSADAKQSSKDLQQEDAAYIQKFIPAEERTHFPKIVWMYIQENISAQSNLTQVLISNIAEYLELEGYDFYLIGEYNFRYLMSNRHEQQLGFVLVDLWHLAYETNLTKNLKDHTFTIKKHLISLIMLAEMGGILIDKELVLTQPLNWLEDFKKITLANKGRSQRPNIIGFYHANYTDSLEEIELEGGKKKAVHLYPPLDPYFLAVSNEGRDFISQVLQRYYVLLEFPDRIKEIIVKYQLNLRQLTGDDPYYQAIYFAFSWVLRRRQMQLDEAWKQQGKRSLRPLALDHYNIYAINRVYGPLKYRFLFSEINEEDIYQFLSKINYNQLDNEFGSVSYISFLPFTYKIEELIDRAAAQRRYRINKKSFIGHFIYRTYKQSWIIENNPIYDQFQEEQGVIWSSLPKKIWVYSESRSIVKQLCLINILTSANASNFELILLRPNNLEDYLSAETLANLKKSQLEMKLTSANASVWVELIKLAIIRQHGGVWLDLPIFSLENFDWILQIHSNSHVLNRQKRLPSVVLFYHGIESGFPYLCQQRCFTRDRLSYSTSFIAAQANANLIGQWLGQIIKNMMLSQEEFKSKLSAFNMTYRSMNSGADLSRLTLQHILAAKNTRFGPLQLFKNWGLSEYGVWVISSFTGIDKLKEYTNFDVGFNSKNIYLWSLSSSKLASLLGNFQYFVHLSDQSQSYLNHELMQAQSSFHYDSQSLFALHLMQEDVLEQLIGNRTAEGYDLFYKIMKRNGA